MIRRILVPVRGDGKGDNVIVHAAAMAHLFNAHVRVVHCRPRPEDLIPFGVPIPTILRDQLLQSAGSVSDLEEAGLRKELTALCEKLNLTVTDTPSGDTASADFIEESGRQVDVIRHHGRLADLIAVAQPDVDRNLGTNSLKAALFQTGRPVMMCPDADAAPPVSLDRNITVAWNGSLEASRAVAGAMPLIEKARNVTILAGKSQPNAASATELRDYFSERGIKADIAAIKGGSKVAKALLAMNEELGADLMIMGAYGDSHERETLFGGNTQYIVDKAKMPVVLVH